MNQNLIRELKQTEINIILKKYSFIQTRLVGPETKKQFEFKVLTKVVYKYRYKVRGTDTSRIIGLRFENKFYIIAFYFKNKIQNIL
ncbi:hypothetical protein ['Camptotheca acuminata' phytoplasma]|uniref:hypothetical protein n=1 Tax='Camptotheca acuminata' phytoplasma TaxID=3239192 RepID=UPI00351A0E42